MSPLVRPKNGYIDKFDKKIFCLHQITCPRISKGPKTSRNCLWPSKLPNFIPFGTFPQQQLDNIKHIYI